MASGGLSEEAERALEALVRLMPPPAEPLHPGARDEWPAIELQLGVRLPADYKALIAAYGTGYVADSVNLYNPFSDNPAVRLVDAAASDGDIYREIRTFEHVPYPIHPEPGGLLGWASSFNGDVFFWVTDPPGAPDSWRIAISEVRGPGWFRHPGPLVRFLAEWLSGEAVVPFLPTLDDDTSFTPSKPLAELEVEWAASRAVWQADLAKATDGGTKPMPGPGFFGPGFPGWPPTSTDGWLDALANAVGFGQVEAAEHLAGMGAPVLPALLELLDQDHPPMFLSRAILGIGDSAMPGVLAVIEARDGRLSLAAVEVLGGSGDDRALDPLMQGLRNGDSGTRYNAAIGFAKLGRSQGEDALIANLGDPSSGVRRETVTALGVVGGPSSVDPVRVLLADPADHVRAEAARAFGRLAGAAGVADLAALLADRIEKVRVGAIDGLAVTGSVAAASALLDRLPSLDPRLPVREELGATITALGRLRERRAIPALEAVLAAEYRDWQPVAGQPTFGTLAATALSAIDGREEPPS